VKEYRGSLNATGKRFALVAGRFNEAYTRLLVDGARDTLERAGARDEDLELVWVPGSFEVPAAALAAARSGRFDAVICLGVLIRGATSHYDLVASEAAAGIGRVFPATGVPAVFGIVTAENLEQAAERCGSKAGNRGRDAALAAVEMANLGASLGGWPKPADTRDNGKESAQVVLGRRATVEQG